VSIRSATVFTHRRQGDLGGAVTALRAAAAKAGVELRFDAEETAKHRLKPGDGIVTDADVAAGADLCIVLGGDGTILHALRTYAGTGVPTFAINYGEVGFLATVDSDDLQDGLRRAFSGDFEVMSLPTLRLGGTVASDERADRWIAANDISFHRKVGLRVADLAYSIGTDEIGRVRCDGLVVSTPAGSTGYNLANGGPVMAWGVEGFAVSFIAPHSLTARALVVAPTDRLYVENRSQDEPVEVTRDGRPTCELAPGAGLEISFHLGEASLAQRAGATFYHRIREKFGRLAS
jgi:NAD+ kinase